MERIYVASRASIAERAEMWRRFREEGVQITSTWIDEDGVGQTDDFEDLWLRIRNEIGRSDRLVLYAEQADFPLKGALIEAGMALGFGLPITICLPGVELDPRSSRPIGSWISHSLVNRNDDVRAAVGLEQEAQ